MGNGAMKPDMDAIRGMSVADRLALVEEIWDSLSEDPSAIPVTETQLAEARRRIAAHEDDPSSAIPWDAAERNLRTRG
jgi:putative addiction module component (TIGR02574 family)